MPVQKKSGKLLKAPRTFKITESKLTNCIQNADYSVIDLDVAQGYTNGAPNETRTNTWRFFSLSC